MLLENEFLEGFDHLFFLSILFSVSIMHSDQLVKGRFQQESLHPSFPSLLCFLMCITQNQRILMALLELTNSLDIQYLIFFFLQTNLFKQILLGQHN